MPSRTSPPRRSRPTLADVAKAAGVSTATVSYVLRGRQGNPDASRISQETRERIMTAVAEIGYRSNEAARMLRRNRTDRILLVLDRMSNIFGQQLATSLEASLQPHGLTLSTTLAPSSDRLATALDQVHRGLADAAIVMTMGQPGIQEVLESAANEGAPMVVVANSAALHAEGFDLVSGDEGPALRTAVDHLVERGHTRFGFIGHDLPNAYVEPRLRVVQDQLALHGIALPDSRIRDGARDRRLAHRSACELLGLPERPTAILSASDAGAIATLWAAHAIGIDVPADLAVAGCGNVEECQITTPPLSSIGPNSTDYSLVSALLLDRLQAAGNKEGSTHLIPWSFVARDST